MKYCNLCKCKNFSLTNNKNRWCSKCHSGERHRAFINEYEKNIHPWKFDNKEILFFSPNNGVLNYMKNNNLGKITTTNIVKGEDIVLNVECMNNIKDNTYDYCILFHVLCVVENDILALNELNRITNYNGYVLINDCISNKLESFQKNKLESGHYRRYGLQQFKDLLSKYFEVNIVDMKDPVNNSCYPNSKLFVCKKIKEYRIDNLKHSV